MPTGEFAGRGERGEVGPASALQQERRPDELRCSVNPPFPFPPNGFCRTEALLGGEEPEALASGEGFVAVATSHRLLRIFTVTGA